MISRGLVFEGDAAGNFYAYNSDTGKVVWQQPMYTSIIAPPISYALDGIQLVAILTGFGGYAEETAGTQHGSIGRLVVFKLGGDSQLPVPAIRDLSIPQQPPLTASTDDLDRGDVRYHNICRFCHGEAVKAGAGLPDLRMLSSQSHEDFLAIVLGGVKKENGMASFADLLTAEDAARIHQYIISRANLDREIAMSEQESD